MTLTLPSITIYLLSTTMITNVVMHDDGNFGTNILEENGRISLAYENLRTIPHYILNKFAAYTKCLDLSHNDFHNLSFLSSFSVIHTLILDRNCHLDVSSLPYLPNLKILWINNCDITNLTDWIKRIQTQCPILEQLSMAQYATANNAKNLNSPFVQYSNFILTGCNMNINSCSMFNYQEFVLQYLPTLKYLNGCACNVYSTMRNDNKVHVKGNANDEIILTLNTATAATVAVTAKHIQRNVEIEETKRNQDHSFKKRISLAYGQLVDIPTEISQKLASQIQFLDLSHNDFRNLSFLIYFNNLQTLILDRNCNLQLNTFPELQNVKILWLNNCNIINVEEWLHRLSVQCPNLNHLSMMCNPVGPTLLNGVTSADEQKYRKQVQRILPQLKYFDGVITYKTKF